MGCSPWGEVGHDFAFTFTFHALEKDMAAHSSALAWSIPGTVEPGGLPSVGSHRVGHDWSDLAAAAEENVRKSCMGQWQKYDRIGCSWGKPAGLIQST